LERAFRNIEGVELAVVSRLNLLQLAPGGHLGRFIIWTQAAFEKLNQIFGTYTQKSAQKVHFHLPRSIMANADIARVINSNEVQSKLNAKKSGTPRAARKQNPLRNKNVLLKLNPHAKVSIRHGIKKVAPATSAVGTKRAAKRSFLKQLQSTSTSSEGQPGQAFLGSFDFIHTTTSASKAKALSKAKGTGRRATNKK